jgi:hypothetical protein
LLQPLPTAAGARMMKLNFERLKFLKQRGHLGFAMFSLRFEPNGNRQTRKAPAVQNVAHADRS